MSGARTEKRWQTIFVSPSIPHLNKTFIPSNTESISFWRHIASLTIVCVQACFVPVCPCCCLSQRPLDDSDSLVIFKANGACISCIFLRLISCSTSRFSSSIRSSCHAIKLSQFCLVWQSISCCLSCLMQDIVLCHLLFLHPDVLSPSSLFHCC